MKQSTFTVTTGVILCLSAVALFVRSFEHSIPATSTNRLSMENGTYMQRADHQPIDWRPLSEETFSEARRKSKPILLVIGTEWSRSGRKVDTASFSDLEIARQIARDFIPVRVDGTERPEWLSTFLPLRRLDFSFLSGFQAWVFAPSGELIDFIGRTQSDVELDRETMFQLLLRSRQIFDDLANLNETSEYTMIQRSDYSEIQRGASLNTPDFGVYTTGLLGASSAKYGGFPSRGLQVPAPSAWQYLLAIGRDADAIRILNPILLSPFSDAVNGGFYRLCGREDCRTVELDKVAVTNAQMIEMLAELSLRTGSPFYRRLATDASTWMLDVLQENGHFAVCQTGDEVLMDRSVYSSFSPRKLRLALDVPQREWARKNLGLMVQQNPQMLAYATSPKVFEDPAFPDILAQLRAARGVKPELGTRGLLDVDGYVAARLLRAARWLDDPDLLARLAPAMDKLEVYRSGRDVTHETLQPSISGTYLGDYLAYADAMLQDAVVTGRILSFENGLEVLDRAVSLFQTETAGCYSVGFPIPSSLLPQTSSVPEIADGVRESCSAQLIRLLVDYARLIEPGPRSQRMRARATEVMGLFANLKSKSPRLAAYYLASATLVDGTCAFAVGPDAQDVANRLARMRPNRLVAAVAGSIRPDLRGKPAGIYVVSDASVVGPLTLEKAAELLPSTLRVGVDE